MARLMNNPIQYYRLATEYSTSQVSVDDFFPDSLLRRLSDEARPWTRDSRYVAGRMPKRGEFTVTRGKGHGPSTTRRLYEIFVGREPSGGYYVVPLLWNDKEYRYDSGPGYECSTQKEVAAAKRTIRATERLGALEFSRCE